MLLTVANASTLVLPVSFVLAANANFHARVDSPIVLVSASTSGLTTITVVLVEQHVLLEKFVPMVSVKSRVRKD